MSELPSCRVLLAEDAPETQRLVCRLLEQAGVEVAAVDNGRDAVAEALAAARAGRPFQVILMDMEMPVMDGHAAVQALRQQHYAGPIIALTAHGSAEAAVRCRQAGCDGRHVKPIDRESLLATVARHAQTGHATAPAPSRADSSADGVAGAIDSQYTGEPGIARVLDAFVTRLPNRLAAMAEALDHGDYRRLRSLAHQLKGAGGMYGYPAVTVVSGVLERAARDRDIEAGTLALADMRTLIRQIAQGRANRPQTDHVADLPDADGPR